MIDLHTHTTASDGTDSPSSLIDYAIEKKLKAIAITDHDTIRGLQEATQYADILDTDLEVIPGIEFSTGLPGYDFDIHILGLFIDPDNKVFTKGLEDILADRNARNQRLVALLNKLDYKITMEELQVYGGGSVLTRAHFASVLVQKGYFENNTYAFEELLGNGKPAFIPRENVSTEAVIKLINQTGGISAIAHPTLYKLSEEKLFQLIKTLKSFGLKAIESYYSLYDSQQHHHMRNLAKHFGLLEVGGSDYHGGNKKNLDLGNGYGNLIVPDRLLDLLKENQSF